MTQKKKQNQEQERKPRKAAFLIGGAFYGALLSFSALYVIDHRPGVEAHPPASRPQGPAPAAGQAAPAAQGGGAPMMAQIGELRKRVEQNPQDRGALLQLGSLYAQAGMWSDAGTFFEQAVELTPEERPLLIQLGNFHYDGQQWSACEDWYDRALRLEPDDPNVLTDQGFCLTQMGEADRALEKFTRANEIDPSHWQSLRNIVVVAGIDLKRFEQARAALEKIEQIPGVEGLTELRDALEQAESGEQ